MSEKIICQQIRVLSEIVLFPEAEVSSLQIPPCDVTRSLQSACISESLVVAVTAAIELDCPHTSGAQTCYESTCPVEGICRRGLKSISSFISVLKLLKRWRGGQTSFV
jgi:hypothetical protein